MIDGGEVVRKLALNMARYSGIAPLARPLMGGIGAILMLVALLLTGGVEPTLEQCEAALQVGVSACERYFQSFNFVLWAGKSAGEALTTALFETHGEA